MDGAATCPPAEPLRAEGARLTEIGRREPKALALITDGPSSQLLQKVATEPGSCPSLSVEKPGKDHRLFKFLLSKCLLELRKYSVSSNNFILLNVLSL